MAGAAAKVGKPIEAVMDERRALNPTRRFGTPAEFGAVCAFLCSVHAGYITGQNILLDGGAYPGTL
jgi:3-oxoacyl-[acyl-carrier protein] reductase